MLFVGPWWGYVDAAEIPPGTQEEAQLAVVMKRWLALPRHLVTEDASLRIPSSLGANRLCHGCKSTGNCGCGNVCRFCEGKGRIVTRHEDQGQAVYFDGGLKRRTTIDGRLSPLLEGLTVFRTGATSNDFLAGVDEAGDVVVMVAPIRDALVRRPRVSP